jgi:hypothetical protein
MVMLYKSGRSSLTETNKIGFAFFLICWIELLGNKDSNHYN